MINYFTPFNRLSMINTINIQPKPTSPIVYIERNSYSSIDTDNSDLNCHICTLPYNNNKINLKCGSNINHYMCKKCLGLLPYNNMLCPWCRNKIGYINIKEQIKNIVLFLLYSLVVVLVITIIFYFVYGLLKKY
jgi:hypothetical protein